MTNLTSLIAELEKLEQAATPGPWSWDDNTGDIVSRTAKTLLVGNVKIVLNIGDSDYYDPDDTDFILAARSALPKLLACVKVLVTACNAIGESDSFYSTKQCDVAAEALSKCESIIADKGEK